MGTNNADKISMLSGSVLHVFAIVVFQATLTGNENRYEDFKIYFFVLWLGMWIAIGSAMIWLEFFKRQNPVFTRNGLFLVNILCLLGWVMLAISMYFAGEVRGSVSIFYPLTLHVVGLLTQFPHSAK